MRESTTDPAGAGREQSVWRLAPTLGTARAAVLVCVAYYIGAKIGFALTLKPYPVSTLWPPNSILLAALLLTPTRSWWALLLAALPAHLAVELQAGVPAPMVLSWFVSNSAEALIGAGAIRRLVNGPLRFDSLRGVSIFIVFAALATFLSSFLDAAFVTLNRWGQSGYWDLWRVRFFSNLLASLTLVPAIVTMAGAPAGRGSLRTWPRRRYLEAGLLTAGLLLACTVVFAARHAGPNPSAALVYVPLPLLLWAAMRFGPGGTSACLLIVSLIAIWGATRGQGPFLTGSPADNALAIQLFLILIAVPLMILAAALREREQAVDQARQNEERLTLALSAAQMGTWDWDIAADKASWSDRSKEIFGLPDTWADISLEAFRKLIDPEDLPSLSQAMERAVARGDRYEAEFRVIRPDGGVRWVMGRGKAVLDAGGRPHRMLGVTVDITDRKRTEEVLRESEERFRLIANSTPAYLWMSSPDGKISFINTPLATFLGVEEHDLGDRWIEFVHPDDVAAVLQEYREAKAQRDCSGEYRMRRHDGEYRWMIDVGAPRRSPEGEFLGYTGSLIDITERRRAEDALREQETQVRLITDTLPAFVAYVDADQRYRFNNRVCEQWHERSRAEMFGMSVREVIGEELYAELRPYIDRALAGESVTYEAQLPIPGMGLRSHIVTHAPDVDPDGRVLGFVAHGYDNTQRKQADAAVVEWKNRYEAAVQSSDQLLYDWDPRTNAVTYGGDLKRILGYSEAEMAGGLKRWLEVIHPDDRAAFNAEIDRVLATDEPFDLTFRICRKDGETIWVEDRGHFFRDAGGRIVRMVGFVRDITARKRAEAALRSSEERFAKAFRSSPDAIAIARQTDARIIEINERWETMFGYSRAEAIGRTAAQLGIFVKEDDRHRFRALMAAQGYVRDFEVDLRTQSGEVLRAVMASETVDMEGDPCIVTIIRDVTEQRRGELEAAEQRRQVAHLGRVALLGELSGALAHELNQPLTAILANARAAQRLMTSGPSKAAEVHEILEDIAEDDRRAGEVIHRLRALLRKGELQRRPLDLNEVVTEVLELMHSDLIQRRCVIETRMARSLPPVHADRVQVQQVLLNLIVNACDAMAAEVLGDRRLTIVTALTDEGFVQLSIVDQGTGIPEDQLDRVFEPFVSWKENGLGLGLTICRSLVTAHEGRLWAVNNPDRGATFHLTLNAAVTDAVTPASR